MNPFFTFFIRTLIALPTTLLVWLVSYFGFEQTFLISTAGSLAAGAFMFVVVKWVMKSRFIKEHGLSRKEYRYIEKNLEDAKRKINRLNKTLFTIRNVTSFKQNLEIMRVTRKIYSITKKEPRRFYQAEQFYFSHLDSLVELSEKYAFLSTQPKKNREIEQSLYDTRRTIERLSDHLEEDLYKVLSNDLDELNFEIDVAKNSIKTIEDQKSLIEDESRRIK